MAFVTTFLSYKKMVIFALQVVNYQNLTFENRFCFKNIIRIQNIYAIFEAVFKTKYKGITMDKFISVEQAVSMVKDGMTLMIGGFLGVGSANKVLKGIHDAGIKNLTIIGNDTAFVDKGVGIPVANHQVKKAIVSHIGTNPETIAQLNSKELEIEFVPQGTLAERIRCGGAGLGGVLTPTGLGTVVAEGKRIINVDGKDYLLELPIHADMALLGATVGDETGNLVFKGTTQNFNPMMAMAADVVIAEIENIVKVGEIAPEAIHTQNIFVDYIVK
mgnify:CR=1 FL=1